MQRSEDGCDMRRFRSFNYSKCKTVLNLLEAICLKLRKTEVERVIVVKFGVHNRGRDVPTPLANFVQQLDLFFLAFLEAILSCSFSQRLLPQSSYFPRAKTIGKYNVYRN